MAQRNNTEGAPWDIRFKSNEALEGTLAGNLLQAAEEQDINALRDQLHGLYDAASAEPMSAGNHPVMQMSDEEVMLMAAMIAKSCGAEVELIATTTDLSELDPSIAGQLDVLSAHSPDLGEITEEIITYVEHMMENKEREKRLHAINAAESSRAAQENANTQPSAVLDQQASERATITNAQESAKLQVKMQDHKLDQLEKQSEQPHLKEGTQAKIESAERALAQQRQAQQTRGF